jgi:hypothetical protein
MLPRWLLPAARTLCLSALLSTLSATVQADALPPRIEVAFALDTTGSMGSYIREARERIRAIAEGLAEGDPRPVVRFGLVEFRDQGDAYVTRVHPFTAELSEMQRYLDASEAAGGGDTPEAVLEGVDAAIRQLSWTPPADKEQVVRLLYLVGDAPAQHHAKSPSEASVEAAARARGIVLHVIACSSASDGAEQLGFGRLARHTEGRPFVLGERGASIASASTMGLGATVAATTRAYSSSAGVRFDAARKQPVASSVLATPRVEDTGLRGAEARWVHDSATFSDLWTVHTSSLPRALRPALPSIDFGRLDVLVLGGSEAGLDLLGVDVQGELYRAEVQTGSAGVRFVTIAKKGSVR